MRLILALLLIVSAQALLSLEIRAQSQTPSCPSLKISCPTDVVWPGTPTTLSLNISGSSPETNLKYRWSLSEGEITSGQWTPQIVVDTSHINGQKITATVEVEGMRTECDRIASCDFSVIGCGLLPPSMKFDEYDNLSLTDEAERLDNFAIQLQQTDSGAKGYVIIYGPRRVPQHLAHVRDYLVEKRGIDLERIVLVNGGHNKKVRAELWVVPTDGDPPTPDPNF